MKKFVIFMIVIFLFLLVGCSYNTENFSSNNAVETDKSLSRITEFDAVRIAENGTDNLSSQYDTHDAIYYSDGTWHVLFYNKPIVCDGGVTVIVDEKTKKVVDIVGIDIIE